jgi:hypothetical protein
MKAYWGIGSIAPRNLGLGTRWKWVVSFTPRPLYPQGKIPWYPLDKRLGGLQSRSGRGGEEKNSQPLPGLEPPIIQPLAQGYTSEITRLLLLITVAIISEDYKVLCAPSCNFLQWFVFHVSYAQISFSWVHSQKSPVRGRIQKFPDWVVTK